MRKTIKLAVVAALALGATSAFATNGDHLIGLGAKARGMGGANVATSFGAESGLANPALISSVKASEASVTATIFMPKVSNNMGAGLVDSKADMSIIPEISYATRINDDVVVGFGMWGTAGMGVDYSGQAYNFNMVTNLQLMQIGVPIAYKVMDGLSVGFAPVLQYGSLNIEYSGQLDTATFTATPGTTAPVSTKQDAASDTGFGFTTGATYTMEGATVGLTYKSAIAMTYDKQISSATTPFANFGLFGGSPLGDVLEQPAEIGIGGSYTMGEHTVGADYKQIKWADAAGYGDFGWDNQTVAALGYQYKTDGWSARVGYNRSSNPVVAQAGATSGEGAALNMFNLTGFPAIVKEHMALGGTYDIDASSSVDVAYVIASEEDLTYSMAAFAGYGPTNPQSVQTVHSQSSLSVQYNYAY